MSPARALAALALASLFGASCGLAGAWEAAAADGAPAREERPTEPPRAEPSPVKPPQAASPTPEAPPPGGDREFTVLACGDILLARTPGKRAAEHGFRYLFQDVRDLVSEADIAFANLETPASYLGEPYPGKPENVTFRADPATLFGLAWAGFDVVSLANNHMTDYGPRAVAETLDYLDLLGIARCGAGRDLAEAARPAVLVRDGVTFAFLAYADPIWSVVAARDLAAYERATRAERRLHGEPYAEPERPDASRAGFAGVASIRPRAILDDVARVRAELRPDYLFVSVHWGDEHQHIPTRAQRALGRAIIDAGAQVVLGHHPHVLQSIERRSGGLIVYSLGNFVFDMAADHTYETMAVRLVLKGGALSRADVIPIRIERGSYRPVPATGDDAAGRLRNIRSWSGSLGASLVGEGPSASAFFQ